VLGGVIKLEEFFMRDFWLGLKDYKRAHHLIWKEGIWKHMIIPGFLGVLYFPVVFGGVYSGSVYGMTEFGAYIGEKWIPKEVFEWMAWGVSFIAGMLGLYIGFLLFRSVLMILYTPFIGFISESAEKKEFGTSGPAFSIKGLMYDIYRGTMVSLISLGYSLLLTLVCWAFLLIPVAGVVISFVGMIVVQAYFAGVGFVYPVLERRRYGIRQSLGFSSEHKMRVMGNGTGFMLIVLIPILGWFVAPTYAIVAAAIGGVESLKED
jgi:CysZ protein